MCSTLKHVLGVAEADEQALIAEMAGVLSDAEIDSPLRLWWLSTPTRRSTRRLEVESAAAKESGGRDPRAAALEPVF